MDKNVVKELKKIREVLVLQLVLDIEKLKTTDKYVSDRLADGLKRVVDSWSGKEDV